MEDCIMVAANLKMQEIPLAVTRSDLVRELRRMLDKKLAKTRRQMRKYENDHNEEMANCMDWYAEGMEYAIACLLDLDEAYVKAYTVKVGGK
jgi:hypothetical protein